MSSLRHTAFKLVVAGGIAVASGLLALYKLSVEPVVLDDADGLGLLPGSSSMTGGSNTGTSSGSSTPDTTSLKRSPITSPQTGMSRLGSFSTLATLAEEDEDEYEGYSPVKSYVSAAASADAAAVSADEEEPDWGDGPDSPLPAAQSTSCGRVEAERAPLDVPSDLLAQLRADEATVDSSLHPSWFRLLHDPPSLRPLSTDSSLRSLLPPRVSA